MAKNWCVWEPPSNNWQLQLKPLNLYQRSPCITLLVSDASSESLLRNIDYLIFHKIHILYFSLFFWCLCNYLTFLGAFCCSRGGGFSQKLGAQLPWSKKVDAQNFYFHCFWLKKWMRSCALCAIGSATPNLVNLQCFGKPCFKPCQNENFFFPCI